MDRIPTGAREVNCRCNPAYDSMRLERLCRYAGRPPVATERLSLLPDGRLLYRLKRRWRDGTSHVILEPLKLIEKLAALVPPPRFRLVRYNGVPAHSTAWDLNFGDRRHNLEIPQDQFPPVFE